MASFRLHGCAAALLLTGCAPKVAVLGAPRTATDLPEAFPGEDSAEGADLDTLRAQQLFADPHLVALIDEALAHNRELGILGQELEVERAEIVARRGEVFPKLGLGVDAGVEKVGSKTSQGVSDEAHRVPEHLGDFRIQLQASWEIDLWKKLRNATQAARDRFLASAEGRGFFATGLVAEVASTYYELVAFDGQLRVLDENTDILRDALETVRLQQEAARVTVLAGQRFEAELHKNEARRFELRQRIVELENTLNALVGRYPQPVERDAQALLGLALDPMDAGVPAQLLSRRPDIRAAERELEAAKLDVKVARARYLPSLAIDARFGIEAFNPAAFAALPGSLLYEVASQLLAPLINRAEIDAGWLASNARQSQAVLGYEQAVLLAVVDVANQLAAIRNADGGFSAKGAQVDELVAAIETSNLLFRSARADYLEVLTTRREALEAELELIETRLAQIQARVGLYRALGGGWPGLESAQLASVTRR